MLMAISFGGLHLLKALFSSLHISIIYWCKNLFAPEVFTFGGPCIVNLIGVVCLHHYCRVANTLSKLLVHKPISSPWTMIQGTEVLSAFMGSLILGLWFCLQKHGFVPIFCPLQREKLLSAVYFLFHKSISLIGDG